MTAPTTTPEIDRYLAAVRTALADLSAEDRDDLMEDVESHLSEVAAEVAAEDTGSLESRLGKPADYAAELRSSAGLPMTGPQARGWPFERALAAATQSRAYRDFRAFLPELRPGWWVFRGYLAVWLLSLVLGEHPGVLPTIGGNEVLGLLLTAAAIWGSVRLGRLWQVRPPQQGWVVLGAALAILAVLAFVFTGWSPGGRGDQGYYPQQAGGPIDGQVSNIYAFDSDGRPLTGVQLFDQDGRPIELTTPVFGSDGMEVPMRSRYNAAGAPVHNVYPREPDNAIAPAPPFAPPRLAPSAGPSASPSAGPSASPSTGPSASPSPVPSPR